MFCGAHVEPSNRETIRKSTLLISRSCGELVRQIAAGSVALLVSLAVSSCYYVPDWDHVVQLYDKIGGKDEVVAQPAGVAPPTAQAAQPPPPLEPVPSQPPTTGHAAASSAAAVHREEIAAPPPATNAGQSAVIPGAVAEQATSAPTRLVPPKPSRTSAQRHRIETEAPRPAVVAEADSDAYALHLGSYHKIENLKADWRRLSRKHPEYLNGLRVRVATFVKSQKDGTYYRLKAGPLPDKALAAKLCRSLKAAGAYCAILKFTGSPLDPAIATDN